MNDDKHMCRALRLAALGRHASPNPMVGCVIVAPGGKVIGEGYHPQAGMPHAEVYALRQAGAAARGATAYVSLEPCAHHGRTPPCADALLGAGVARVVAALTDPDPRVAGRGLERLRAGGVAVTVGVGEAQARALNAAFLKHRATGLPWVVLKTAMTLDGKIAATGGNSRWITSPLSRLAVHRQLRDRCDVLLTGVGTVFADDPALTTRLAHRAGRNPLRVIVDSRCRTPLDSQVVRLAAEDGKTLIATTEAAERGQAGRASQSHGCQVLVCDDGPVGPRQLSDLMRRLGTRTDVIGVLVEGGGNSPPAFSPPGWWTGGWRSSPRKSSGGVTPPARSAGLGLARMAEAWAVREWRMRRSGPDFVIDARFG